MTDDEIFAGIDEVPWAEIEDGRGSAPQTPAFLRGLRSPSEAERWDAWDEVQSIYHLGDRFPATSHAVPFLTRMALASDTPDRHLIVDLLAKLAIGYDFDHFPSGYDEERPRQRLAEVRAHTTESWEAHLDLQEAAVPDEARRRRWRRYREYLTLSRAVRDAEVSVTAYEAVAGEIPKLRPLLGDEDAGVRAATAYLLAWFPREADASVPALIEVLADEPVSAVTMNVLVALGLVSRDSTRLLTRYLEDDDVLLSWTAAMALTASGAATETVVRRLGDALRAHRTCKEFLFLWGEFSRSASQCLSAITGELAPMALDVATEVVAASSAHWAARPAKAALALAFPDPCVPDASFADLTAQQQGLLRAIADLDAKAWSGNGLELLLRPKNLPCRQSDLRTYVSAPPPDPGHLTPPGLI